MKHETTNIKTKALLSSSLKKIMQRKPLSKISVTDIITVSDVNRKTFYYHFDTVYDLLRWTFEQETFEIVKQFDLAIEYSEALIFVMEYIESNEYIINCISDPMGLDAMRQFFFLGCFDLVKKILGFSEEQANKKLNEEYKKFLCVFYSTAVSGILLDWFMDKRKEDKQLVCDRISATIKKSINGVLEGK